jgi:hypothetical protein
MATPEGRTVHYRLAPATGLRSTDYEVLTKHLSTVYPYRLANATSEYLVRIPHLFMDPTERDHVSDPFLLELSKVNYPAPIVNMVDIRQICGDSLSTIPKEKHWFYLDLYHYQPIRRGVPDVSP